MQTEIDNQTEEEEQTSIDRRTFMKRGSVAAAGASFLPSLFLHEIDVVTKGRVHSAEIVNYERDGALLQYWVEWHANTDKRRKYKATAYTGWRKVDENRTKAHSSGVLRIAVSFWDRPTRIVVKSY